MSSVYEIITDKFIEMLNNGVVPWHKSWGRAEDFGLVDGNYMAINYVSRKPYHGINSMLLIREGEYLTFKQIEALGGRVKKGSHADIVIFWKPLEKDEENKDKPKFMLRYYKVFHLSDTEGIPTKIVASEIDITPEQKIEVADKVAEGYTNKPVINERPSDRAYWSPITDNVVVPLRKQFDTINNFYSTLFHELVHSTGHKDRLNREDIQAINGFGDTHYAKEELTAEIGASILSSYCGFDEKDFMVSSAGYLKSWIGKLKDDHTLIFRSSALADKAVKHILGTEVKEDGADDS